MTPPPEKDHNYVPLIVSVDELESVKSTLASVAEAVGRLRLQVQLIESWAMILERRKADLEVKLRMPVSDDAQENFRKVVDDFVIHPLDAAVMAIRKAEGGTGPQTLLLENCVTALRRIMENAA